MASTARTLFYPERFKRAARYYTTGRPAYPKLLSRRVAELVGLTKQDTVLDLGTGPGFLALDFAPLARLVTAIDPSPEMLAVAAENARHSGARIELIRGSSYELGAHLGSFKLVTIGRAFHWMDRPATLEALAPLVVESGAVALFSESYPSIAQNAWHTEFQAIVDSYSTDDPARPQTRALVKSEAVLLDSAFDHLERISVIEQRATPVDRFVDRALSFAAAWEGRPGSRENDLAGDIWCGRFWKATH
jgi:SAM-dependent methyltransferase